MPDASNDKSIGRLEGKLDMILDRLDRDSKQSVESRTQMHEALEKLTKQQRVMDGHIKNVDERLSKVEPLAEDINKWRERGIGILMFVGLISASVGTAVTAFWNKIAGLFS